MSAIDINSEVLGGGWEAYYSSVPAMLEAQQFRSYDFLPESEYHKLLSENIQKGRQVYIDEILYRAHFSAFVALARTHTWFEAVLAAEKAGNYFGVCSALRGLLESSADINHSLNPVATTLAMHLSSILKLYHSGNEVNALPNLGAIEDALIHFMYSRKLSRDEKQIFPKTHWEEKVATYIGGVECCDGIGEFYSRLCGISHPAADTVAFFEKYDHLNGSLAFSWKSKHSEEINKIANEFRGAIDFISTIGYNTPLLLLGVLNEFHMPRVASQNIYKFPLGLIPAWKKLKDSILQSEIASASSAFDNVVKFPQK